MRLFVIIGGVIVLVLLAALVGPYFVDWSGYRDRFEAEASRILGQEVHVAGDASARILPFPSVTFSDVRVGPQNSPNVSVEKFSMDVELAPFLRGEILIFDMRFVSPVVRLDLDEEGRPKWDFPSAAPVDPAQIILEQASFTDGTVVLRDTETGRQWDFLSLNGTAAAQSLYGPWRVQSEGLVRGKPFEARISTGNLAREGFSTRVQAILPESKFELVSEGRVAAPTPELESWYTGTFSIKPIESEEQNYLIEGLFEADARSLNIDEFRGDFGTLDDPYTINGSANIQGGETPSFNFQAKGNQVSFEEAGQEGKPVSVSDRLADIQNVLSALPIPAMSGTIDLDLPTIVAGNTTIRDLKLRAEPQTEAEGTAWTINRLEAQLPGRTVLEGDGILKLGAGDEAAANTSFSGNLVVASLQPSGLAAWLSDDVDDTIRLLPNAGFASKVELTAERQVFSDLELVLGQGELNGSIERRENETSLPYLSIDLAGENARYETIDAISRVLFGAGEGSSISGHDIDATFDLTNPQIRDMEIGSLTAALRVRGRRVEIDTLSARDIFGASISATGTLSALEDEAGYNSNFDVSLISAEGAPFVRQMAEIYPGFPVLANLKKVADNNPSALHDTNINIVGTANMPLGQNGEASASVSGGFGGSDVSLTATVTGSLLEPARSGLSIAGTITNPEATVLLAQSGLAISAVRPLGEGQLDINAMGDLADGLSTRISLQTPDSFGSAEGVLEKLPAGFEYVGALRLQSEDAEPWLDLFGYILPATGLGTPAAGEARLIYSDGTFSLSDLSGQAAQNAFEGKLAIEAGNPARSIEGELKLAQLDLEFLAGILTGRYDLSDEAGLYNSPLYTGTAIDLRVSTDTLSAMEHEAGAAQLRLTYRDGGLFLRDIEGETLGGTVSGSVEVQNDGGALLLNSGLQFEDIDLTAFAPAELAGVAAEGSLTLSVTGSGNSTKALVNSLTGSGVLTTSDVTLPGINRQALAPVLEAADEIGYEITENQITDIARRFIPEGNVELPELELPVSVNNGRITIDNIAVALDGATLSGALAVSLGEQVMSGEGQLTYDAGEESVAGSQPQARLTLEQGSANKPPEVTRDYALLVAFVRQRALEREQARVEALQARLLEKQRLRRQVRYLKYLQRENFVRSEEERLREIAAERRAVIIERQLEEQRVLEEQQRREAEEAERQRLEEERRLEEQRRQEQRLLEEQNKREEEEPQRAEEGPGQDQSEQNPVDDALIEDPFAPFNGAHNPFENLDFDTN